MLCEVLKAAGHWLKKPEISVMKRILVLIRDLRAGTFEKNLTQLISMSSVIRCRLNEDPKGRPHKSHAPVFSLFTFFADSQ